MQHTSLADIVDESVMPSLAGCFDLVLLMSSQTSLFHNGEQRQESTGSVAQTLPSALTLLSAIALPSALTLPSAIALPSAAVRY